MLAGDRSQGVAEAKPKRSRGEINPASILSESRYCTRSRKSKWPEVFAKCQVRWAIITAILTFSDWI